jgi:iron complex transport system permease protein
MVGRDRAGLAWTAALALLLVPTFVVAVSLGGTSIDPGTVWSVIGGQLTGTLDPTLGGPEPTIVWQVRVPRVLLGALVGALLAVSGVALQALVRNILAEPYLIGVSSGASVGAAIVILFGSVLAMDVAGTPVALTAAAFVGGLAATVAVFLIARMGGRLTPVRLVLAGVTMAYGLSAVTSMLVFMADSRDGARGVLFWLLGSLDGARWSALPLPGALLALGFAVLLWWGRRLDVLAMGDDTALALGVSPGRFRAIAFVLVALCVAAAVAVAGPIGFVGLVVPHLARLLVGASHRAVLPVAAIMGALVMVWADVVARSAMPPRELPIGVVTAIVGAPLLLLLVRRFPGTAG